MKKKWKVLYYETESGICPVKEFIGGKSISNQQKIVALISFLEEEGIHLTRPYSDYLQDGIHELRVKLSGDETRTLYFFCFEEYIILTHTFSKRSDKVPIAEINKALQYKEDFLRRYDLQTITELLL